MCRIVLWASVSVSHHITSHQYPKHSHMWVLFSSQLGEHVLFLLQTLSIHLFFYYRSLLFAAFKRLWVHHHHHRTAWQCNVWVRQHWSGFYGIYGILYICIKSFEHMCLYVSARKQTQTHTYTCALLTECENECEFSRRCRYITIFEKRQPNLKGNIWFIYLLLLFHLFIFIQSFRHFVNSLAAHSIMK